MSSRPPRPLVILGCGYIGAAVAREALSHGREVHALVRSASSAEKLRALGLTSVVTGDIAGDEWHARLPVRGAQAVFSVSTGGGDLDAYRHTYLAGMDSALRWASAGLDTLVYTSSTGVYLQSNGAIVDESAPGGGDAKSDLLVATENRLMHAPELAPLGRFVLRFGGLYGPGRHYLLDKLRRGETVIEGPGDFRINSLHRDDAVSAVFAAIDAPRGNPGGIYNVTDGNPATKADIVRHLAEELGVPCPRFDAATLSGRAARRGAPSPDRVILADKIQAELDWSPRHLDFRSGYAAILASR